MEIVDSNIQPQQKPFWIVNTHIDWGKREKDLIDLFNFINNNLRSAKTYLKESDIPPVFVMGDFNGTAAGDEWYKTWQRDVEQKDFVGKLCFDAYHSVHGRQPSWTYNCGLDKPKPIDFIFVFGLPKTSISECYISGFKDKEEKLVGPLPSSDMPSDHVPLTAKFKLN